MRGNVITVHHSLISFHSNLSMLIVSSPLNPPTKTIHPSMSVRPNSNSEFLGFVSFTAFHVKERCDLLTGTAFYCPPSFNSAEYLLEIRDHSILNTKQTSPSWKEHRSQILLHTQYILSEEIAQNCDWCKYEIDTFKFPAGILWNVPMISDRIIRH